MIPVGTLCLVLPCNACRRRDSHALGRIIGQTCEVVASPLQHDGYDCVVRFPDAREYAARYCDLRPIAPPGDPDAVPHSEPELVEVFR